MMLRVPKKFVSNCPRTSCSSWSSQAPMTPWKVGQSWMFLPRSWSSHRIQRSWKKIRQRCGMPTSRGLLCDNVYPRPMLNRPLKHRIHRLPYTNVTQEAYRVPVLPALQLLKIIPIRPAHGRYLVSMRGDGSDQRPARVAGGTKYLQNADELSVLGYISGAHTIQWACFDGFFGPGGLHVAGSWISEFCANVEGD
jgi:hypothetical protein